MSHANSPLAVLWDFGGVILSSPFDAFRRYEREIGLPDDFIRSLNARNPDTNAWARMERSEVSLAEFVTLFEAEAQAQGQKLDGWRILQSLSGDIRPQMVEALRRCKAAFRVACITNNMKHGEGPGMSRSPEKARAVAEIMTLFEHVVESSKIGFRKPDPRIYRHACDLLGVPPDRCIYLDDLGINLKPARALGMRTIKVGDPDQAIAELETMVGIPLKGKDERKRLTMSWQPEIDELRRREELARGMGGPDKIKRQHDGGKLTVRQRIERLLDKDSFHEVGAIAGKAEYDESGRLTDFMASNFVMGRGRIDGRPVVVGGDDFTVRGGAADASIWEKQMMSEQMAGELGIPIVRLVDGTGGGGSVKTYETTGFTYVPRNPGWEYVVDNLAKVPVVALGLGSVAGLGSARLVTAHYSLMVTGISQMFVAGPPVVARLGEKVTKEELGGTEIHARNGAVDDEVQSEDEAFARTRRFLSYLPPSIDGLGERVPGNDDPNRREASLIEAIPRDRRKVYRVRPIVEACVDRGSFFEIGKMWGRSVVTGLARLDGWPVAVMASDPYFYGGGWTADASHKVIRFVDFAETFHLPVVHFIDIPGFIIGVTGEKAATIRHGARALAAIYQSKAPWCSILMRKSFGVAGAAHQNWQKYNFRYAWPSGDWGSLPLEGGIEAAYKAELAASPDPAAHLAAIEARLNKVRSPFRTAERFGVEEIIDPRDTRRLLCEFAQLAAPMRKPGPRSFGYRP